MAIMVIMTLSSSMPLAAAVWAPSHPAGRGIFNQLPARNHSPTVKAQGDPVSAFGKFGLTKLSAIDWQRLAYFFNKPTDRLPRILSVIADS